YNPKAGRECSFPGRQSGMLLRCFFGGQRFFRIYRSAFSLASCFFRLAGDLRVLADKFPPPLPSCSCSIPSLSPREIVVCFFSDRSMCTAKPLEPGRGRRRPGRAPLIGDTRWKDWPTPENCPVPFVSRARWPPEIFRGGSDTRSG